MQSILEIELELLTSEQERGLSLAELLFAQMRSPTASNELADALEKIIREVRTRGLTYPPVLLKRKKQLTRKEWRPREVAAAIAAKSVPPAVSMMPGPARPDEEILAEARANFTPEQFERWKQQSAAWKRLAGAEPKKAEPAPDQAKKESA